MIEKDYDADVIKILHPDSREVLAVRRWNPFKANPGLGRTGGYIWSSSFPWVQEILDRYSSGSTIAALDEAIMEALRYAN